jgi:DNA-binding MarR family transcriptional regulator
MSKAKELQAPIEQLLHALYRRDASKIAQLSTAFSKEARRYRVIQAKSDSAAATDYQLGGWEVLEALAVRANARQAQNARLTAARLRYALDVLQLLARRAAAMSPGLLTDELRKQHEEGVHGNNVSRLIARLKAADLVSAHEGGSEDARTKPVEITENGRDILEGLRPGWRSYGGLPAAESRRVGAQARMNSRTRPDADERPPAAQAVTGPQASDDPRKRLSQQRKKLAAATKNTKQGRRARLTSKRKPAIRAQDSSLAHVLEEQ